MRAKKKSEIKLAYREQARRKVRPASSNGGPSAGYRNQVEQGREHLLQVSAEGGDSQAKKTKNELMYLLNNYLPSYHGNARYSLQQGPNPWKHNQLWSKTFDFGPRPRDSHVSHFKTHGYVSIPWSIQRCSTTRPASTPSSTRGAAAAIPATTLRCA